MHYTAAAPAALLVLLAATAAGSGRGGGGGGGLPDVARGSRRVARGLAGIRSASPSKLVFQLEVTPCYVVCPLCFAFDMYTFCEQNDDIDSVCALFRANPTC